MRLFCFFCGKSVSTEVPADTILRALCVCPECVPTAIRENVPNVLTPADERDDEEG